jgi:predicted enzyme related to lactoylglutathione lyase
VHILIESVPDDAYQDCSFVRPTSERRNTMTEVEKISVSISVDVPDLDDAIRFYTSAFGFTKSSASVPGVAVLRTGNMNVCLLEKRTGTRASTQTQETRHYERHWTPVHLDVHVDDLEAALARALEAGAVKEQTFENAEHGSAAFCSYPFGHGFCLIQRNRRA